MACPNCGCKVHYQFNTEEDFAQDAERLERCAACRAVFDIEDAVDDEDDEPASIGDTPAPQSKEGVAGTPAHSKSEYKRRVAQGDPNVTPPAGVPASDPARPFTGALNDVPATLTHDEGAYAQCGECGRYTLNPNALTDRPPPCDCGSKHGWSGSFKRPGPDAKWSGLLQPAAGVKVASAPQLLGQVWMAFGTMDDGRLVALPEYAAVSEREVGSKIMDSARREGYRGLLADRLQSLGWSIRRVTLAAGVRACDETQRRERMSAAIRKHFPYSAGSSHDELVNDFLVAAGVEASAPAYRLLTIADTIQAGDECLRDDAVTWGPLAGWEVGMRWNNGLMPLRRRTAGVLVGGEGEQQ